jgi:Mg2+-importing ATPase
LTQTLIIHIIRTNRIPFLQSWACWPLTVTTATIMLVGAWLPFSPLGPAFGFTPLPAPYWPLLALTLVGYVADASCKDMALSKALGHGIGRCAFSHAQLM